MNIFVTNRSPALAARNLGFYPKLQNKMILESAQLFFTACAHYGLETPYKPTHKNHPCSVWVRQCIGNLEWLFDHAAALNMCYRERAGKHHKSFALLVGWMTDNAYKLSDLFPEGDTQLPYLAMDGNLQREHGKTIPNGQKTIWRAKSWEDAEDAYREYLSRKEYAKDKKIIWQ